MNCFPVPSPMLFQNERVRKDKRNYRFLCYETFIIALYADVLSAVFIVGTLLTEVSFLLVPLMHQVGLVCVPQPSFQSTSVVPLDVVTLTSVVKSVFYITFFFFMRRKKEIIFVILLHFHVLFKLIKRDEGFMQLIFLFFFLILGLK